MKMNEPMWLDVDEVVDMHAEQLAVFGGPEGVRDRGLLESAVLRPVNQWHYGQTDMAALAAAYAFGLARNHAFVDGNKRTAFVVCRLFLRLNGFDVRASQEEKYLTFLHLAAGSLSETELAQWLRERLVSAS